MVTENGRWYLVGHDRDRDATRTFRLSRIGAEVTPIGPDGCGALAPTASTCAGIVAEVGRRRADRRQARVWVADGRATALRRAGARSGPQTLGGRDGEVFELDIGPRDRLAREIAGYGADAIVLEPESLRENVLAPAAGPGGGSRHESASRRGWSGCSTWCRTSRPTQRITFAEAAADLGVSPSNSMSRPEPAVDVRSARLRPRRPDRLSSSPATPSRSIFSAGMDRPLRLTSPEATGLLVALRALVEVPGVVDPEAARSAIAKIESAAGTVAHGANSAATASRHPPKAAPPRRSARRSGTVAR